MTTVVQISIPGTPTAKGRPRFTSQGRTYTDAKTKAAEAAVLASWMRSHRSRAPHDGPVTVDLVATFTPAPSWPKWKREAALTGTWPHTIKPDIDNLLKVIDGLNGTAWVDDSQIVTASASKLYGSTASTLITITFHPATR